MANFLPNLSTIKIVSPSRYEIILKCWENVADKRPTFTEIVSRYHDGLIAADTSKAEQGGRHAGYVLLGPEEEHRAAEHPLKKLSKTQSVVDISTISLKDLTISSTPSVGTTFNVIFLSPRVGRSRVGEESNPAAECAAMADQEYYIKMERNCVLSDCAEESGNVLVNQAALHEYYDDVTPQDRQEEEMAVGVSSHGERRDGHVTTNSDHVTSGSNHCLKSPMHANEGRKLNASTSDYILMRAARDHISDM